MIPWQSHLILTFGPYTAIFMLPVAHAFCANNAKGGCRSWAHRRRTKNNNNGTTNLPPVVSVTVPVLEGQNFIIWTRINTNMKISAIFCYFRYSHRYISIHLYIFRLLDFIKWNEWSTRAWTPSGRSFLLHRDQMPREMFSPLCWDGDGDTCV